MLMGCLEAVDINFGGDVKIGSENSFYVGLNKVFKLEGNAHNPNELINCKELEDLTTSLLTIVAELCEVLTSPTRE